MRTVSILLICTTLAAAPALVQASGATPTRGTHDPESAAIELATLEITAHPTGADERTAAIAVVRPNENDTALRIADLLAFVPGIHLDQTGGAGGRSTLYLRGGEENHTLVLLDGVPLNDPTNSRGGGVDFSLVEPAALDSAAVVRGPGSMRHGPDAISGVIHFDTAGLRATGTRASIEGGGDGLGRASLRTSLAPRDQVSASLGATWHEEDAADDAGSLRRTFLHGSYHQKAKLDFSISAWHLDRDASTFPDDSGGVRYAVIRDLEKRTDRQTALALQLGQRDDDGSWSLGADITRLDASTVSPGVAPGLRDPAGLPASVDDIRLDRMRAAFIAERRLGAWTLSGGIDAAREDGTDVAVLDFGFFQIPAGFSAQRDRFGGFFEGTGTLTDRITVSAGMRGDRFDDVGTHATGRVGLLGTITENTLWRANAGSGFKAPSFFGLAHPLVGNPDLKPERGRSVDVGLRHTFSSGRGLLDLSLFASELRNGVDFSPGPPPMVANVAEIRSQGVEAAAIWRATRSLHVSSSLSYTDVTSQPEGTRMRSRPRWRGAAGVEWIPLAAWTFTARLISVDRVPDSSIPTGDVMLPGWARVDVAARWAINEYWSATVACDNLLDRRYEEVVGFTAPARRLRAGVQFAF